MPKLKFNRRTRWENQGNLPEQIIKGKNIKLKTKHKTQWINLGGSITDCKQFHKVRLKRLIIITLLLLKEKQNKTRWLPRAQKNPRAYRSKIIKQTYSNKIF